MTERFLDKVYHVSGQEAVVALYDEWAEVYDEELTSIGYVTPTRLAAALADTLADRAVPILDFGCGTGLSGTALHEAGFGKVDGTDLSAEMLRIAATKKVYRRIWQTDPDTPIPVHPGDYAAITAVGVISIGAAPGSAFDALLDCLAPGGLFAFSMNDQSMTLPDYIGRVRASLEDGRAKLLSEAHGPHLTANDQNSGSTVFVLERLGGI
ncbi:MAG: methyltransferase domain-containing protein [Pseudomonadota bacterium]